MKDYGKIFLILGIIIIVLLILNIYRFFSKNKIIEFKKNKKVYEAIVIDKREYNENSRELYYVTFSYDDMEKEFLVNKYLYNSLNIHQIGKLIIKYECFDDFIF